MSLNREECVAASRHTEHFHRITMRPLKRLYTSATCISWLLEQQRDLHLILKGMRPSSDGFGEPEFICSMASNLLPQVFDDWLRKELPTMQVGIVRKLVVHSKNYWESWFVPYVDFDLHGLAHYLAVWEGHGEWARKAGFRRMTLDYSAWRAELSSYRIHDHPRQFPATVMWFDTPLGLFWSPWDRSDNASLEEYNKNMIWTRLRELFPDIVHTTPQDVFAGILLPLDHDKDAWLCVVSVNERFSRPVASQLGMRYDGKRLALTTHQRALCNFLGVDSDLVTFTSNGY